MSNEKENVSHFMHETQEVKKQIPENIRSVLWFMLQELDAPSPNHHFKLNVTTVDGDIRLYQHIIHTQKNTTYRREFSFKCFNPVVLSVYIVGFDNDNWLMLLQP